VKGQKKVGANSRRWKNQAAGIAFFMLTAAPAWAQQVNENPRRAREDASRPLRPLDPSDLGQQNLNRVAASAAQLRAVLAKDEGLQLELKRWIAKEATDSGQVVDDSDLTESAIFERLEVDIEFRGVATRIVQRYGYLLPTANPDSDAAKEKEFVLKERARRLVQIESQEDSRANSGTDQRAQGPQRASLSPCDGGRDSDCSQAANSDDRRKRRYAPYKDAERTPSDENWESIPGQLPSRSLSQLLQTEALQPEGMPGDASLMRTGLELGEESGKRESVPLAPLPLLNQDSSRMAAQTRAFAPGANEGSDSDEPSTRKMDQPWQPNYAKAPWRRQEEDATPVRMVRRPNPYANVPSLYDMYTQASAAQHPVTRFGLNVFEGESNDPRAIPMDLPAGPDYVVGPGDGIEIDLWGGVSQRFFRVVDRQGRLSLPDVGPLLVAGRSLGEVQQAVQQTLRTEYRDVSADVSLSKLRTVRVYVVGEVKEPGAYDISSLSTPLNALFAASGVKSGGSLRALKHYRGKQLIEEVDSYDLLLHGVRSDLHRLENGDTLLVPPVGPQVTVDGMVRRPAIYELHGESSLSEVLELAGGVLPTATLRHVEVQRVEAHEKRTMLTLDLSPEGGSDSNQGQLDSFKVSDGDAVHIFPIAPYNESAVYLDGHVLRPGRYSYKEGMKFTDLIGSYKDLLPEPSQHYAEIIRLNAPDFRPSVESFDLAAALAHPETGPKIKALDTVRIFSRFDFEAAPSVWIGGEVRGPGKYGTSGQARLRDAIHLAGGVSPDAAMDSAQLFRTQSDGTLKIISVNLGEALAGNPVDNLLLESRDRLLVHKVASRVDPPTVYIKGEVAKPGRYPLTANMRPEDLIRVAGGLKRTADSDDAELTHYTPNDDSKVASHLDVKLSSPNGESPETVALNDGDVLTIRKNPGWSEIGAMIAVKGEVEHPGTYGIKPGERLSSVLARAGGFGSEAYPYGAVLMRREVREIEMKAHLQLVQRVKAEETNLKSLPETDAEQKNQKLNAIAQTETALTQLQANMPVGRVVVHIQSDIKQWRNSSADVAVRDGDVLMVPKRPGYVLVNGQVYNPTAVSYQNGRSAKWYLSQAGGLTQIGDKNAVFVIRADGSVLSAKGNRDGFFSANPLDSTLRAGDTVVVPEKAPRIGGRNWQTIFQAVQVASSVALSVAYIHP
jgi:protein involved in polysaccharide export with SLBB domain